MSLVSDDRPVCLSQDFAGGQISRSNRCSFSGCVAAALMTAATMVSAPTAAFSQTSTGGAFVDDFKTLDHNRWVASDGWTNGAHQNCTWSAQEIKLDNGVLDLSFEKRQFKTRDYVCGEIQSKQTYGYGVYEARMKTDTGSGLNSAFFTYLNNPWDEIDVEILTKDTSKASFNTYVSGKPKNGKVVDVPGGTDKQFNDYAFVWQKDSLRWYLNGQLVHEAPNTAELPTHPQKIFFSIWGTDTLNDWMGPFADPGRKVTLQVERVAYTPIGAPCQFPESVACHLQASPGQ
jgi:endo-1,3-1,4-beta-glycanase ExoK